MMAGGSTVLSMVLVICLIGLLIASPFGIFFSGEDSGIPTELVLSGASTRETLNTYAYRPSIVLDGVGDIPKTAKAQKTSS